MYINTNYIQPVNNIYSSESSTDHGTYRNFNRVLEQYVEYLGDHPHQRYKSHMAGLHRQQQVKNNQQQQNQQGDVVDNVVLTHEMLELKLAREASKTNQVHWELYDYPEHVIDSNV